MQAQQLADGIMIRLETWDSLWPDARELMLAHKAEVGQDDPRRLLSPNHALLRNMERNDMIVLLGARSGLRLVGYDIWYLAPDFETVGMVVAAHGPWYVMPEWRASGVASRLWEESMVELRRHGVSLFRSHTPAQGGGAGLDSFYRRKGGVEVQRVWEFWLPADGGERV